MAGDPAIPKHRPKRSYLLTELRPLHDALCQVLVRRREAAGLTQTELAVLLRRPQSFFAKLEGGERRLALVELFALSQALGCQPEEIVDELRPAAGLNPSGRRS